MGPQILFGADVRVRKQTKETRGRPVCKKICHHKKKKKKYKNFFLAQDTYFARGCERFDVAGVKLIFQPARSQSSPDSTKNTQLPGGSVERIILGIAK